MTGENAFRLFSRNAGNYRFRATVLPLPTGLCLSLNRDGAAQSDTNVVYPPIRMDVLEVVC